MLFSAVLRTPFYIKALILIVIIGILLAAARRADYPFHHNSVWKLRLWEGLLPKPKGSTTARYQSPYAFPIQLLPPQVSAPTPSEEQEHTEFLPPDRLTGSTEATQKEHPDKIVVVGKLSH